MNQAAYQLQQNLGRGVKTRPPGVEFWPEVGCRQGEIGGVQTPNPPAIRTLVFLYTLYSFHNNYLNFALSSSGASCSRQLVWSA